MKNDKPFKLKMIKRKLFAKVYFRTTLVPDHRVLTSMTLAKFSRSVLSGQPTSPVLVSKVSDVETENNDKTYYFAAASFKKELTTFSITSYLSLKTHWNRRKPQNNDLL